jgi:Zn-dependent metalloprotease
MKKIVFVFFNIFILNLSAQNTNNKQGVFDVLSYSKFDSIPTHIKFKSNAAPIIIAENINSWFQKNLNGNSNFNLKKISGNYDLMGNYHEKFIQYYKNLPVINSMVNTHYKADRLQSLNGHYFPELNVSETPQITEQKALEIILSNYPVNTVFAWQNKAYNDLIIKAHGHSIFPEGELCIVAKNFIHSKNNFHLAYQFKIYGAQPAFAETIYIDAINGEILHKENLMCEIDVPSKGKSHYGGLKNITCDSLSPNSYILEESGNRNIKTYNALNTTSISSAIQYYNDTNYWNFDSLSYQRIAIDIHWGLEKTIDFYKEKLNRNSIDNAGYNIIGLANYDNNLSNAFWNGQFAAFGNGDGTKMGPLGTLDVCGHEISHGLTGSTAGLIYSYESGALNESFSDIFGKCVEHYAQPSIFNWNIGDKVFLDGSALRDMRDPYLYNQPKYYKGINYAKTSADNGGVHTNSGIQNHWFYLLCVGGKEKLERTKIYYTVDSIGWDKATALAYSNLTNYLTPMSDYQEAADLSIEAAGIMYGEGGKIQQQVIMAWFLAGLASQPQSAISNHSIANGVKIYPNPAQNTLFFESNSLLETIKITDVAGKIILNSELNNGHSIDISALVNGIYFIQFKDGSLQKFVKL